MMGVLTPPFGLDISVQRFCETGALAIAPNTGGRGTEALDASDIALTCLSVRPLLELLVLCHANPVPRLGLSPFRQHQNWVLTIGRGKTYQLPQKQWAVIVVEVRSRDRTKYTFHGRPPLETLIVGAAKSTR